MTLSAKAAYLKGLAEGLDLDKETKEGKILLQIIDLLSDMTEEIEEIIDAQNELSDYCEMIDEDLEELEEDFYDCPPPPLHHHGDCDCDEVYFDDDIVACPACDGEIALEDEDFENMFVICPYCGEKFDLDECEECDCCDCEDCDCE